MDSLMSAGVPLDGWSLAGWAGTWPVLDGNALRLAALVLLAALVIGAVPGFRWQLMGFLSRWWPAFVMILMFLYTYQRIGCLFNPIRQ